MIPTLNCVGETCPRRPQCLSVCVRMSGCRMTAANASRTAASPVGMRRGASAAGAVLRSFRGRDNYLPLVNDNISRFLMTLTYLL